MTVSLLAAVAAQTAAVAVAALAVAVERRVGLPLEQKAAESTQLAPCSRLRIRLAVARLW